MAFDCVTWLEENYLFSLFNTFRNRNKFLCNRWVYWQFFNWYDYAKNGNQIKCHAELNMNYIGTFPIVSAIFISYEHTEAIILLFVWHLWFESNWTAQHYFCEFKYKW